ncbi:MAG: hypothetical protein HKO66_09520 [Saprospiraceae bacterium]|nr:hypothetical protein [Bacteroidia bacterium]NNL92457.1 hypothetical protein [Saprospiraceae bacterium]
MNFKISLLLGLFIFSCKSDVVKPEQIDKSYRLFNEAIFEQLGKPLRLGPAKAEYYLCDFDTITKDSFKNIYLDSIYHIFTNSKLLLLPKRKINFDSLQYEFTYSSISKSYASKNSLDPAVFDLSYYSDNLLGVSLGTREKGEMMYDIYDVESLRILGSNNKPKYDGSFYIGSRAMTDTFDNIRVVLSVDRKIFEKSFSKAAIDDRVLDKKSE